MVKKTMEIPNLEKLMKLSEKCTKYGIPHIIWKEEPENIISALATYPRRESIMKKVMKGVRRYN